MPRVASRIRQIALIAGLSAALGGCVVAPARPVYYGGAVAVAPPAARVEYYGTAPYPGYFWIGGYWRWGAGRYVWVPGRWSAPRPGYRWVPRRWVQGPRGGWHLGGGRWVPR